LRHLVPVVAALTIAALLALTTGASATPGPGGWDNLGTGATATTSALNGAVYALNADAPGVLYVGGAFTDAGGNAGADYIASWNGTTWAALGSSTLNGAVHAIAYFGGKVYVGGVFTNAGGNPNADFLAVWDGTSWGTVCTAPGSAITANVSALQVIGSTLYVGGSFQNGAGIASADYLLACDLNTGAPRSTVAADGDFSGAVYALTADSHGALYAGGGFINLDRIPAADKVAYLDGGGWHAMGSGTGPSGGAVTDFVRSLAANGTDVYIGTDSTDVAGIAQADHVVKWNGSAWSAVGSNTAGTDGWFPASTSINALTTSGSSVFAGGTFQNANGDPLADQIAYFDGTTWHPLGSNGAGNGPLNGNVTALATFDRKLYAGGSFTGAGGNTLASFAASFALPGAVPPGGTPPSGTPTGTVLVNGTPFTGGPIAFNSKVDVTGGSLLLTTDTGSVTLSGGGGVSAIFVLLRGTDKGQTVVEMRLTGGDFSVCKRKLAGLSQVKSPTVRQLWGNGTGRFRTRGRFASATVRGTNWLTADRCDGTLTKVRAGRVEVRDLVKRKTILVPAGKSYLAKKR
jgi:hypothetical protein